MKKTKKIFFLKQTLIQVLRIGLNFQFGIRLNSPTICELVKLFRPTKRNWRCFGLKPEGRA